MLFVSVLNCANTKRVDFYPTVSVSLCDKSKLLKRYANEKVGMMNELTCGGMASKTSLNK